MRFPPFGRYTSVNVQLVQCAPMFMRNLSYEEDSPMNWERSTPKRGVSQAAAERHFGETAKKLRKNATAKKLQELYLKHVNIALESPSIKKDFNLNTPQRRREAEKNGRPAYHGMATKEIGVAIRHNIILELLPKLPKLEVLKTDLLPHERASFSGRQAGIPTSLSSTFSTFTSSLRELFVYIKEPDCCNFKELYVTLKAMSQLERLELRVAKGWPKASARATTLQTSSAPCPTSRSSRSLVSLSIPGSRRHRRCPRSAR